MLTPATKDGNTQGAPTTAPKTCCDTGNLCLLLPATVTQCLTGFASRGQRPDPSIAMELKTIFTISRTFKAFEDPRQAWGHSVHHWRSPWLRVTGHDYWLWISVISRRADNNGCVFCEKLISGAPDSLLLPSWQSQCSHSSSLSSASRSPLSLPEHWRVLTFWMYVPQVCPITSTLNDRSLTWTPPQWVLRNVVRKRTGVCGKNSQRGGGVWPKPTPYFSLFFQFRGL